MKKINLKMLALATLVSAGMCQTSLMAQNNTSSSTSQNNPQANTSDANAAFFQRVSEANMAEIEMGRLAMQRATSEKVRAFAKRMVDDHTKANAELQAMLGTNTQTTGNTTASVSTNTQSNANATSGSGSATGSNSGMSSNTNAKGSGHYSENHPKMKNGSTTTPGSDKPTATASGMGPLAMGTSAISSVGSGSGLNKRGESPNGNNADPSDNTSSGAQGSNTNSGSGNAGSGGTVSGAPTTTRDDLASLNGAEFERQYAQAMVREHNRMIEMLETESKTTQSAELKQWIAQQLPIVRHHRTEAMGLTSSSRKGSK